MLANALHRHVLARHWVCFLVLGLSFLIFGAGSLNLFFVLHANLSLIAEHGWLALVEGAAVQLLEILLTAYVSMLAYILFKSCEYSLVHGLVHPPQKEPES